jgi:hypothetical protein
VTYEGTLDKPADSFVAYTLLDGTLLDGEVPHPKTLARAIRAGEGKRRGYTYSLAYDEAGDHLTLEGKTSGSAALALVAGIREYLDNIDKGLPSMCHALQAKGYRDDDRRRVSLREQKLAGNQKKLRVTFRAAFFDGFGEEISSQDLSLDITQGDDGSWRSNVDLRSVFKPGE